MGYDILFDLRSNRKLIAHESHRATKILTLSIQVKYQWDDLKASTTTPDKDKSREQLIQEIANLRVSLATEDRRCKDLLEELKRLKLMDPPESERRYRNLLDSIQEGFGEHYPRLLALLPAAMYTCNSEGVITYYNEQAARIWGRSPRLGETDERFCGAFRLYLPDGSPLPHSQTPMAAALREEISFRAQELTIERPDGSRVFVSVYIDPLHDASGRICGAINVFMDITERKRAEQALEHEKVLSQEILRQIPAGVAIAEVPSGKILMANHQLWQVLGTTVTNTPNNDRYGTLYQGFHADGSPYPPEELPLARSVLFGETIAEEEILIRRNDGSEVSISVSSAPVCDSRGRRIACVALVRDITEKKNAEKTLHRLNTTLEQRVAERTALAESRAKQLQALSVQLIEAEEQERRRIADLLHDDLQQLLSASRFQLSAIQPAVEEHGDAKRMLQDVDRLLAQSIEKSRRLSHDLCPAILHQAGLAASVEWLARQMLESHGLKVEVEVHNWVSLKKEPFKVFLFRAVREMLFNVVRHAGVDTARVSLENDGDRVQIRVSDRGRGFEPQSLSERANQGKGFGLFSIRERVNYIGGNLQVESKTGQGSCFTITLSLKDLEKSNEFFSSDPGQSIFSSSDRPASKEAGLYRILLVDDHKVMRQGLIALLDNQPDIEVVGEAANGIEAGDLARELFPDVILMDVSMPEMDGVEATRRITAELPEVRVIGLSMYEDERISRSMRQAGAEAFVSKTASSSELLKAIYGMASRPD
jgi:PAS domain S-box-containing protein